MTFIIFMSILLYMIIGSALMPLFTRASFKSISEQFDIQYAKKKCGFAGFEKSLIWPVALSIHFSVRSVTRALDAAEQKEKERKETERILQEYKNNDPVAKEFKRLEEEEKEKKNKELNDRWREELKQINEDIVKIPKRLDQQALTVIRAKQEAGMVLDEKGIWDYPIATTPKSSWDYSSQAWSYSSPDVYEIRNADGSIAMTYEETRKKEQMEVLREVLMMNYENYRLGYTDMAEYHEMVQHCEERAKELGFSLD